MSAGVNERRRLAGIQVRRLPADVSRPAADGAGKMPADLNADKMSALMSRLEDGVVGF